MEKQKFIEKWKTIPNYEDYQVSTYGRVKRLAYYKNVCGGSKQYCEERILKPQHRKLGYLAVHLSKNSVVKSFLIHRLVAIVFIPNPNNLPQVNHKDENTSNNHVENLEWCDQKYNSNYGTSKHRIASKLKNGPLSKSVEQYDRKGVFIGDFSSAMEASRQLGLTASGIVACCNSYKKYNTCGGFQWKYKNSKKEIRNIETTIVQLDKNNIVVNTFSSITEASKYTNISRTSITNCLSNLSKTAGGYI